MKGRKPIPTPLHVLRGTYRPARHGQDRAAEPIAPGDLPIEPPQGLTSSQSAIWTQAMQAAPKGILKLADFHTLLAWVVAADQHETARSEQARLDAASDQPLVVRRNGVLAPSPYIDIMHRAHMRMMKASEQLGFSPVSRPRLSSGQSPEPPDGEWSELARIVGKKESAWDKLAKPLEPRQ